ncbi:hypothetical protein ES703_15696 [subsurface metagenome]
MGKLEKIVLWILVIIALLISLHNYTQINRNKNIIEILGDTQSYIVGLL